MNIQLSNTEEYIDGKSTGSLGQVLIRYAIDTFSIRLEPVKGCTGTIEYG